MRARQQGARRPARIPAQSHPTGAVQLTALCAAAGVHGVARCGQVEHARLQLRMAREHPLSGGRAREWPCAATSIMHCCAVAFLYVLEPHRVCASHVRRCWSRTADCSYTQSIAPPQLRLSHEEGRNRNLMQAIFPGVSERVGVPWLFELVRRAGSSLVLKT